MKRAFLLLLFLLPVQLFAFVPTFTAPAAVDDYVEVSASGVPYTFYSTLQNFPHTYQVPLTESAVLRVQVMVPRIEGVLADRSIIVLRQEKRGVSEVARMHYAAAPWEQLRDRSTGDTYETGEVFEEELTPGTYLIEVSTGENVGPYALQVQAGESVAHERRGYIRTLTDVARIKQFFQKSPLAVFQSPFYYLPTLLLFGVGLYYYRRHKRKHD